MVDPSQPDDIPDSADTADEQKPGPPETSEVSEQLVPEKQIYRWKDDGGAVMPDG